MGISHKRDRVVKGGRNRRSRPRSFKTEDAANRYAEKNGIKDFLIVKPNNGLSSKFKLVQK